MDGFSPFIGFCQKFKFLQEGVHMCLVARKKELEKKKLENKFKSMGYSNENNNLDGYRAL